MNRNLSTGNKTGFSAGKRLAVVTAAALVAVSVAQNAIAQTITRNNTANALNLGAAWTGGIAPGTGNVATWNSSSTVGQQSLGGSVSWGGISITSGTPSPSVSITDPGGAVLTLGASGINLNNNAATNRGIAIAPVIALGVDQTWVLGNGTGATITASGGISGPGKLTVAASTAVATPFASGVLNLTGTNTFAGGFTMGVNSIVTLTAATGESTFSGGALVSGPFGTGPLTINGGRLNNTNRIIAYPQVSIGGDFTLAASSRQIFSAGTLDFGGSTRTITLTRGVTPANLLIGGGNDALQFTNSAAGSAIQSRIRNGALRLVTTAAAGTYSQVNFSGLGGYSWVDNAGLIIGDRVTASFNTSLAWGRGNGDAPAVTIEPGGYLFLSGTNATRTVTVFSLAGSGTVLNNDSLNAGEAPGTLTIDGGTKTGTNDFAGVIRDRDDTTFGTTGQLSTSSIQKYGDTTQVLSGTNTYTGPTEVGGGVLSVGNIGIGGASGNIGAATNAAGNLAFSGGTLRYTGAGETTDRLLSVRPTGGTIESSGSGPLVLGNTGAIISADPAVRVVTTVQGGTSFFTGAVQDLVPGMTFSATTASGTYAGTLTATDRVNWTQTLSSPAPSTENITVTYSTSNRVFSLSGSNAGTNTVAGSLSDSAGGGRLGVSKTGTGFWRLSGNNSYSGPTTVTDGTLEVTTPLLPVTGTLVVTGTGASARLAATATPLANAGFTRAGEFASITASAAGSVVVPVINRSASKASVLVTSGVSIATGGTIDLGNSDLIVRGGASTASAVSALISGGSLLASGASPLAAPFTTLGVLANTAGAGAAFYDTYDGVALTASDLIVKFTYVGDTNLDGTLDGVDLANVLEGYSLGLSGWVWGDVDHSGGPVSATDVAKVFAAYQNLTTNNLPSLGSGQGGSGNSGAIPEPSGLALLLAPAGLLVRRRRTLTAIPVAR